MAKYKLTGGVFALWIGLLMAGSVIGKLWLENQAYSDRTVTVVLMLFITGVFSSALAWLFFSRFGRSTTNTSVILCLTNTVLFILVGTLVSYAVVALPHLMEPDQGHVSLSFRQLAVKIAYGYLGAGFSFKTFGLPLLWPFGVFSTLVGTFVFVYFNKMSNSRRRH